MVLRKKGNEFALIPSPTNRDIYLADKSLNLEKNNPFVYFRNVCTSARSCELDYRKNGVDQYFTIGCRLSLLIGRAALGRTPGPRRAKRIKADAQ